MKNEETKKIVKQTLTFAVAVALGMWAYKLSGSLVTKIQEKATA